MRDLHKKREQAAARARNFRSNRGAERLNETKRHVAALSAIEDVDEAIRAIPDKRMAKHVVIAIFEGGQHE